MRLAPISLTGLCVLALAGCASGEAPRERADGNYARPPVVIRPLFPADYMATASSIDLYAIRSSELALTRAANPRLRDFARAMIADHRGTSAQLSFGGRRLNLLPSATMLPAHQAMFDELSASGDFDATYRRQQVAVHQAALKLHSDFAARGESPTLRTVARNAAPIERRHLDMLRRM
jgi:putative membrane protein